MSEPLEINTAVVVPAKDLTWSASRAGGPGGQNVNKVASKVELRFDLERTVVLDTLTKSRLRAFAGPSRLDADGCIMITSQLTRDQRRNLEDAREKLRALILRALERPKPRRATKPSRAVKRRRVDDKRRNAIKKHNRSGSGSDD